MNSKCILLDFPVLLSSFMISKWLDVSDLRTLDSAVSHSQLRTSFLSILGYEGTTLNGNFTASIKFMTWLSLRKSSVVNLDYDGAMNHISFRLISKRSCGRIKTLKISNICGDEAKAFIYKSEMLQKLTVSKLRRTSKHNIVAFAEPVIERSDCCSVLTELQFENTSTVPSDIVSSLLGRKILTLNLLKCGNISKEFAKTVATKLVQLASLTITESSDTTNTRLERILSGCTALTHVSIRNCALLDSSTIMNLALYCRNLLSLQVTHMRFHENLDTSFVQLAELCVQVQHIHLVSMNVKDVAVIAILQNMRNLLTLHCDNCPELTGEGTIQPDAYNISKVERITLNRCQALRNVYNIFAACPSLRSLDVGDCRSISYSAITHIMKYGFNLENLTINAAHVYGNDLDQITHTLPKLTELDISSCGITNEGFGFICDICPNLTKLSISGCYSIGNEGLLHLGVKLPRLRVLIMSKDLDVTESGLVSAVVDASCLQVLAFTLAYSMSHTALIALATLNLASLHTVSLSGFRFDGNNMMALAGLIDSCPQLRCVYLHANWRDDPFVSCQQSDAVTEVHKTALLFFLRRLYPHIEICTNKKAEELDFFRLNE